MKPKLRLFIVYASVLAFVLYWGLTFAYSLYVSSPYVPLYHKKSRPEMVFYQNWSLFTPPDHNYLRLYFISKDTVSNTTDTTEVLENLSEQKKAAAPFNQEEDMITQLLYRDLYKLFYAMRDKTAEIKKSTPDSSAPYYTTVASGNILKDTNGKTYVACLGNYAKMLYKNSGIDTKNKLLKIVVNTKEMLPYKWAADSLFIPKEVALFQTGFTPIQ